MSIGRKIKWLFVGGKVVRLNRRANEAFLDGDNETALKLLLRAVKKYPYFEVTFHNLGNVYLAIGKYKDAENTFRKAIEIRSDFAEAMNDLASLLARQGKEREAEELLRKAIDANPDYPYARVNLGQLLINRGQFGEAEMEFKMALESKDLDEKTRKRLEDQMAF